MAKVLEEILDGVYAKLAESDAVSDKAIAELRSLLESEKKLKADDFVAIFQPVATEPES